MFREALKKFVENCWKCRKWRRACFRSILEKKISSGPSSLAKNKLGEKGIFHEKILRILSHLRLNPLTWRNCPTFFKKCDFFNSQVGLQKQKKRLKILVFVEVQEVTAKVGQIWEFGRESEDVRSPSTSKKKCTDTAVVKPL